MRGANSPEVEWSKYESAFLRVSERIANASWVRDTWICKSGLWPEAAAPSAVYLKLFKPHWSPDASSGIFFSIWVDAKSISMGRLRYNLHALKLRELPGYSLQSRRFAEAFRSSFRTMSGGWPNVRTDFGPQTLFEGFVECPVSNCEGPMMTLLAAFPAVGDTIDRQLELARCR